MGIYAEYSKRHDYTLFFQIQKSARYHDIETLLHVEQYMRNQLMIFVCVTMVLLNFLRLLYFLSIYDYVNN